MSKILAPIIDTIKSQKSECIDDTWKKVVTAFNETSKDVSGTLSNKPAKEWLSSDILKLVEERRNLKPKRNENTENRRHYNYLCREIKRESRKAKDTYLREICEEIETAHTQKKN